MLLKKLESQSSEIFCMGWYEEQQSRVMCNDQRVHCECFETPCPAISSLLKLGSLLRKLAFIYWSKLLNDQQMNHWWNLNFFERDPPSRRLIWTPTSNRRREPIHILRLIDNPISINTQLISRTNSGKTVDVNIRWRRVNIRNLGLTVVGRATGGVNVVLRILENSERVVRV